MKRSWKVFAISLGAVVVVALATQSAAAQAVRIPGVTPKPVADGSATAVAPMDSGQMLRITLVLQPPRLDELRQLLQDVVDRQSPRFHRFLTFDQWKARYAPADADVAKVDAWARQNGFTVLHQFRNNLALKVEAKAATIEQAFNISLNYYQLGSRRFFSTDRDPVLPPGLAGIMKHVAGLNSYYRVHPANDPVAHDNEPVYRGGPYLQTRSDSAAGSGRQNLSRRVNLSATGPTAGTSVSGGVSGTWLEAPDLYSSEGYNFGTLAQFSDCCNPRHDPNGSTKLTSIALIGSGSVSSSDINAFTSQYGMAYNLTQVEINNPSCCNAEMTIDIEWSTAMANSFGSSSDTAHVFAYEEGGSGLDDLLDAWEKAQSDDNARSASTSFGSYEDAFGGLFTASINAWDDVLNAMISTGWTIAAASGDHGATDDCSTLSVNFPASNPNVVAVGGTKLSMALNARGQLQYQREQTWNGPGCNGAAVNNPASNNGGGGGGCSNTEPGGAFQTTGVLGASSCGDKRALPDLALNAGNSQATYYNGAWAPFIGTSIASPEMAGFFAQENSYLLSLGKVCGPTFDQDCAPLGNPVSILWTMGHDGSGSLHLPFYDIADGTCIGGDGGQGNSAPFCATTGYDLATGWGSANMLQLAWGFNYVFLFGGAPRVNFAALDKTWYNTDQLLLFTITDDHRDVIGYNAQWDNRLGDVLSHATPGSGDFFYDGPQNRTTAGSLHLASAGVGCHIGHVIAWDNTASTMGDQASPTICYDNLPPTTSCATPDGLWHATDVSIACSAADQPKLSGLANSADANFLLVTSVAAGTETANASTNTHQVCDVAGNCTTAGPVGGNMVDKKPPSITITTPAPTTYTVHQSVAASYGCADGGSGVNTCAGPVASGSNIDTSSVGTKIFAVNASDKVLNASAASVTYNVTYRICLQYNPAQATSTRAENILVQICDANGANMSQMSIVLTATGVDGNTSLAKPLGTLNPGNRFFYGPGTAAGASYQYVLDTQGLSNGTHVLNFVVQGDPVGHVAPFTLLK